VARARWEIFRQRRPPSAESGQLHLPDLVDFAKRPLRDDSHPDCAWHAHVAIKLKGPPRPGGDLLPPSPFCCPPREFVMVGGDPQHHALRLGLADLLSVNARLFRRPTPVLDVIQQLQSYLGHVAGRLKGGPDHAPWVGGRGRRSGPLLSKECLSEATLDCG
jgi:hypothetical protein